MIAGFVTPDSGAVLLDGADVTRRPPNRRNVGLVFQNYSLFPHMTIAANVAYRLKMRRVPRAERAERVAEALELVQLTGRDGDYPRQLSGGQQQRVALARALVVRPSVFLLDEPLSNLDAKLRVALRVEIRELQQKVGITTVFVTHDQEEALTMSDRIVVLNQGRIEQIGTPEQVYTSPTTPFVAGFIGDRNSLACRVADSHGSEASLVTDAGTHLVVTCNGSRPAVASHGLLTIRTDQVTIAEAGAPSGTPDRLDGVVHTRIYLGWAISYQVRVGDDLFSVVQPSGTGARAFSAGDRVSLTWPANACRWLSQS